MNYTQRYRCAALLGAVLCLPLLAAAQSPPPEPTAVSGHDADNTRVNRRDRDNTVTAGDQSNSKADIKVAADVRRAIEQDKSLSTSAHNVKLLAQNGVVTLRGPVANAAEKDKVGHIAENVNGVTQVNNDLDVKNDGHKE